MSTIVFTGLCPQVSILGQYEANGKVLLIPVTGKGEGEVKYCKYIFKMQFTTFTSSSRTAFISA